MKLIVKPESKIKDYIDMGIHSFLLPLKDFSVEYSTYFSLEEIKKIKNDYKDVEIFVSLNKNFMNEDLNNLKTVLIKLSKLSIKAILFYDASIIKIKKDLNLDLDLVWSQTHMVTNYRTCDYYYNKGIKYALLSKEITKEEIIEIINKSKIDTIVELISKPSIAFSKRKLVSNYFCNYNKKGTNSIKVTEKISNTNMIISENNDGVTFIKNDILNGCYILEDLLQSNLNYILLKEDFIEHDLFMKIVKQVLYYINHYLTMSNEEKNSWLELQKKLIGENSGFFFQKTIYKVK